MKKKLNNQTLRLSLTIVLGIVLGVFVCFMAIFMGYWHVEATSLTEYNVKIFGLFIFEIQKIGDELKGIPQNNNLALICSIFSIMLVLVLEVMLVLKRKKIVQR